MTLKNLRPAFTLIELLVVLVIIALVMAMVMPMGSHMLSSFTNYTDRAKQFRDFKSKQLYSFIKAKKSTVFYMDKNYTISSKGVILEIQTSNDDN